MKVLVTNCVVLNGGDAAILTGMIELIHMAFGEHTEIIIYDKQADVDSRYYPDLVFRKLLYFRATEFPYNRYLRRIFRYVNLLRFYFSAWCWTHKIYFVANIFLRKEEFQDLAEYSSADLIISSGGTYLVENYSLAPQIFDYKISLLMKKPLVFFTQSLGPFLKQKNRKPLTKIFNSALLVLLRDEASLKNLRDLNINNDNVHVSSDAVFALADKLALEKACQQSFPNSSRLKIAISVRYWPYFKSANVAVGMKNFQDTLGAVTKHLVEKHNAEIVYISTCQGIPEYNDDSKVATEIVEQLPDDIKKHVSVDTKFHPAKDLVVLLKSYDIVVATRMHMAILSLVAGTPVFPIAYEFKTQELFNRLGLGQWVQSIEMMGTESFIYSLELFINAMPQSRQLLFEKVAKEQKQALDSSKLLKIAFEKWIDKLKLNQMSHFKTIK